MSAPNTPKRKPMSSKRLSICLFLIASTITKKRLLIAAIAEAGPAGPVAIAF